MTAPASTHAQLAAALTAILCRTDGHHIRITATTTDGIRIEITDPAARDELATAYDLRRDHSFSGVYTGTVRGVPVSVATYTGAVTAPLQRKAS